MANKAFSENEGVEFALRWLTSLLDDPWRFAIRVFDNDPVLSPSARTAIDVRTAASPKSTLVIATRSVLEPADALREFGGVAGTLANINSNTAVLVVAPWLSARTQEILTRFSVNYVDLTGNARLLLREPAMYIKTQGAERDPEPAPRNMPGVKGPKAGRLIRYLLDVRGPYGVRELASATSLNPGYVSRILQTLSREALISRSPRGTVEFVDVSALVRRWAQSYDLAKSNDGRRFISPPGAEAALLRLRDLSDSSPYAVTGSFAALRFEQVAAPTVVAIYATKPTMLIDALGLLPSEAGANVLILRAFDDVVFERTTIENGICFVAPSQIAVDCLTGNGRMPAEGDAVVKWMTSNENLWRISSPSNSDRRDQ